jgi:uncharacterized membrane protein YbaN (DUF454 family)
VFASPSHPFLSSAPPHEHTQGALTGAAACGDAAALSPSAVFFLLPAASLRLLGAGAATHASLAGAAIRAWRSHGRHRARQRSSRVDVCLLLVAASLYHMHHRLSRIALVYLRLFGAAAAIYIFRPPFNKIRSGPMAVSDWLSCSRGEGWQAIQCGWVYSESTMIRTRQLRKIRTLRKNERLSRAQQKGFRGRRRKPRI